MRILYDLYDLYRKMIYVSSIIYAYMYIAYIYTYYIYLLP